MHIRTCRSLGCDVCTGMCVVQLVCVNGQGWSTEDEALAAVAFDFTKHGGSREPFAYRVSSVGQRGQLANMDLLNLVTDAFGDDMQLQLSRRATSSMGVEGVAVESLVVQGVWRDVERWKDEHMCDVRALDDNANSVHVSNLTPRAYGCRAVHTLLFLRELAYARPSLHSEFLRCVVALLVRCTLVDGK